MTFCKRTKKLSCLLGETFSHSILLQRCVLCKKNSVFGVFWSVFFPIQIEYRNLLCKSPYSVEMREKKGSEKLRICRLFMQ